MNRICYFARDSPGFFADQIQTKNNIFYFERKKNL